ncbi:CinA family protein [Spelaeicoccus albus]|uniref:Nicotinamide-nucleotide amidase n=1 Tax=Spelaeicoccus albus TaxID=1280376 RepID=A0A7Z0D2U6_9MICO|nr:CinA family protein [Spelaeicoccus albus]NYI67816.1 nicotinamide-nucleotide amidase [Spelaeicoccus albus]
MSRATDVLARLGTQQASIAVAESLTGGLLISALVDVPGASAVVRGGIVAYQTELKSALLGVDAELLASSGAVDARVAEQMASGVRTRLGADWGVATTGVAGPDPQDGHPVGTVFIGVVCGDVRRTRRHEFGGDRSAIRRQSVDAALQLLLECGRGAPT